MSTLSDVFSSCFALLLALAIFHLLYNAMYRSRSAGEGHCCDALWAAGSGGGAAAAGALWSSSSSIPQEPGIAPGSDERSLGYSNTANEEEAVRLCPAVSRVTSFQRAVSDSVSPGR